MNQTHLDEHDAAVHARLRQELERIASKRSMLGIWLEVAVPLRMVELERDGGPLPQDWEDTRAFAWQLAEKGDLLLFGPGSGQAHSAERAQRLERGRLLARLAHAVACLAWLPGGITLLDLHFDAGQPDSAGAICCRSLGKSNES